MNATTDSNLNLPFGLCPTSAQQCETKMFVNFAVFLRYESSKEFTNHLGEKRAANDKAYKLNDGSCFTNYKIPKVLKLETAFEFYFSMNERAI